MATKVKKVNNDDGVQETDKLIAKLEKDIKKEYQLAYEGVSEKLNKYMESFSDKDQKKRDLVSSGTISKEEYNQWRMGQIAIGKRWKDMQNTLAQDLVLADRKAASIVNDFTPQAYALNHNYATYEIEKNTEINTSYTLYNASAVERLIDKKPNLLPKARVDIPKDKKWNQNKINSAVTQGILQGDDLKSISKRLQTVTDMDANAAMRNARTMMTGAQNAGRLDAYKRASKMGIDIQKEWMSTLDTHTRESHRMLDGERRSLDETFSNGLMYPGDTRNGAPEEVYNCRCTLVPYYPEYPEGDYERYDNIAGKAIKYVTYAVWFKSKSNKSDVATSIFKVVNGKDISSTWTRRKDEFDFEIDDVINAQGFDGLPRVVSADEFDEYVKEANGGNGFIAQRTYSAPDKETLDAYRDQLYNGKWYIDCSEGGAQYGQGMYCAADYSGKLSDGIKNEMNHYIELGLGRTSKYAWYEEAKTINWDEEYSKLLKDNTMSNIAERAGRPTKAEINAFIKQLNPDISDDDLTDEDVDAWTDALSNGHWNILTRISKEKETDFYEKYKGFNYIETLTLDPSAKIVSYDDISKQFNDWKRNADLKTQMKANRMDIGSFAVLKGYDAINAENHGESGSYTIILNRTKVIIKGE